MFLDWDNDGDNVNDMYVTAVGTNLVRINKDVTITKGDLLVSSAIPGVATALAKDSAMPNSICIIGKSIESNTDSGIKLVEIAV